MNLDKLTTKIERELKGTQASAPFMFGFHWTFHALARMKVRSIELDWVLEALEAPGRPTTNPEVFKHVGDTACAFVNRTTNTVITIGYGTKNDPEGQ